MTDLLTQLPPDPIYDRRKQIQERAAKTIGRRTLISRAYISMLMGCFIIALIPLGSVIYALINKGIAAISWTFLTALPSQPNLMQQDAIGGIGNAILGTIIIDLLAGLVAVPIGVLLGLSWVLLSWARISWRPPSCSWRHRRPRRLPLCA